MHRARPKLNICGTSSAASCQRISQPWECTDPLMRSPGWDFYGFLLYFLRPSLAGWLICVCLPIKAALFSSIAFFFLVLEHFAWRSTVPGGAPFFIKPFWVWLGAEVGLASATGHVERSFHPPSAKKNRGLRLRGVHAERNGVCVASPPYQARSWMIPKES